MVSLKEIITLSEKEKSFFYNNSSVFLFPEWLILFPENTVTLVGIYDRSNALIGGFCFFKGKKLGKTTLGTPPFFAHNGLFYTNPAKTMANKNTFDKKIMSAVCLYLKNQKKLFISLGFPTQVIDFQPFIWNNFNISLKYTYRIDLSVDEKKLLEQFSPERRKNIVKAQKDQVLVERSFNSDEIEKLITKSLGRKKTAVDQKTLKNIVYKFLNSDFAYAFVASINGKPSSTAFVVHDKEVAYYLLGGFDDTNKHQGAGALCMWNAILHAKNLNLKTFDFEGSMLPEVETYFRGFGGRLHPLTQVHSANYLVQTLLKSKGKKGF